MLSDRFYMRDSDARPGFSALTWLICTIAAGFVVENIFLRWFNDNVGAHFFQYAALSSASITSGYIWTLVTHALVHNPNNLFHLGFTLLSLYLFGRAIADEVGQRRLIFLFVAAVVAGGAAYLGVNWHRAGDVLYGASAGVSAFIVVFALLSPEQPVTLFTIDIGMRAKHLAIALLIIDVLGLALLEIPGRASWFEMSHSAHLGGMFIGWLYFQYVHQRTWGQSGRRSSIELPRWLRRNHKTSATAAPAYKVNLSRPDNLRAEVDRILDKINSDGFKSLTAEEKKLLDNAREQLSRR